MVKYLLKLIEMGKVKYTGVWYKDKGEVVIHMSDGDLHMFYVNTESELLDRIDKRLGIKEIEMERRVTADRYKNGWLIDDGENVFYVDERWIE